MASDSPGREGPRQWVAALAAARRDEYVIATDGNFTYRELLEASGRVASRLLVDRSDLEEARVAFRVPPSFDYVAV